MIVSVIVASAAIFALMLVWVWVDRVYRSSLENGVDSCELPRHECCHCMMADACVVQPPHPTVEKSH